MSAVGDRIERLRRPSVEHYLLLGAFLLSVLGQLKVSGDGWHHFTSIDFWMFTITQLMILARGMYSDKPEHKGENE